MANFTPAPWAVNPFNAQVDAFDGGEPLPVCQLLWPTELRTEATTEANARLIAAAPALYEALRRVVDTYGFDPSIDSSIWNEAAEALSLALGESPNA